VLHNDVNRVSFLAFVSSLPAILVFRLMGKKRNNQQVMSGLVLDYLRGGEGHEWEYLDKRKIRPQDLFVEISAKKEFQFQIAKI